VYFIIIIVAGDFVKAGGIWQTLALLYYTAGYPKVVLMAPVPAFLFNGKKDVKKEMLLALLWQLSNLAVG
jgi:hypothetical protein